MLADTTSAATAALKSSPAQTVSNQAGETLLVADDRADAQQRPVLEPLEEMARHETPLSGPRPARPGATPGLGKDPPSHRTDLQDHDPRIVAKQSSGVVQPMQWAVRSIQAPFADPSKHPAWRLVSPGQCGYSTMSKPARSRMRWMESIRKMSPEVPAREGGWPLNKRRRRGLFLLAARRSKILQFLRCFATSRHNGGLQTARNTEDFR